MRMGGHGDAISEHGVPKIVLATKPKERKTHGLVQQKTAGCKTLLWMLGGTNFDTNPASHINILEQRLWMKTNQNNVYPQPCVVDAYVTVNYNAAPWERCAVKRFRDWIDRQPASIFIPLVSNGTWTWKLNAVITQWTGRQANRMQFRVPRVKAERIQQLLAWLTADCRKKTCVVPKSFQMKTWTLLALLYGNRQPIQGEHDI